MVSIVPSRFAGLKIEDDDDEKPKKVKVKKPKELTVKPEPVKKPTKPKKAKKPKNSQANHEDFSKWQQKDNELVDNYFESDLQEALLQSRLDFEANKDRYTSKEADNQKLNGKGKKSRPLSLQEFQAKVVKDEQNRKTLGKKKAAEKMENERYEKQFFDQINSQTQDIIRKEKFKDLGTQNLEADVIIAEVPKKKKEPEVEEEIDLGQILQENEDLKVENETLRIELETLRARMKKMLSVLKNAENKDKTELLVEIEKLKKVQNEMQSEIASMYIELEQEKSKHASASSDTKHKDKGTRKSVRFDASSEFSYSSTRS